MELGSYCLCYTLWHPDGGFMVYNQGYSGQLSNQRITRWITLQRMMILCHVGFIRKIMLEVRCVLTKSSHSILCWDSLLILCDMLSIACNDLRSLYSGAIDWISMYYCYFTIYYLYIAGYYRHMTSPYFDVVVYSLHEQFIICM